MSAPVRRADATERVGYKRESDLQSLDRGIAARGSPLTLCG